MNEIIESLYRRKSVRVFEDRAIPEDMKTLILESAMQAPSAGCQQLYTILDITDQELKEKLAESCDHQPFIAKAPMVLVFCADCKKWYDAYLEAGCGRSVQPSCVQEVYLLRVPEERYQGNFRKLPEAYCFSGSL